MSSEVSGELFIEQEEDWPRSRFGLRRVSRNPLCWGEGEPSGGSMQKLVDTDYYAAKCFWRTHASFLFSL